MSGEEGKGQEKLWEKKGKERVYWDTMEEEVDDKCY